MRFTIPGQPIAKGRMRVSFTTKRTYTPEKTVNYENLVKHRFTEEYPDHEPIATAIKVDIFLSVQIPQSWSKKKQSLANEGFIYPTSKPDLDNCAKIILDALNEIAWIDDKQVVELSIGKRYSITPMTVVTIAEI